MQPLPAAAHSRVLSDVVAAYLRGIKHRGQLKLVHGLETVIGRRRWNVRTSYGFRIAVDLNDMVQKYIMDKGHWDEDVATALSQRWSKPDVFFDVGANIGFFSLFAARHVSRVVAFEPMPTMAELVAFNSAANGASDRLTIERTALGERNETAHYIPGPPDNSGQGHLGEAAASSIAVPVRTLDRYIAATGVVPTIMKIDVEGHELAVLRGARNLLKTKPPHTIVFEADATDDLTCRNGEIVSLLTESGYTVQPISGMMDHKADFLATRD